MKISIKNMVCPRCIIAVRAVFRHLKIAIVTIALGEVITKEELSDAKLKVLKKDLALLGFELLNDRQTQLINSVKSIIIEHIHSSKELPQIKFSELLSKSLAYEYAHLSRLFSSVEGRTIEQYVLAQKVEKVKELLTYDELTISEIAYKLSYSSSAHLSSQFKKITGMTPSAFKKLQKQNRTAIDKI